MASDAVRNTLLMLLIVALPVAAVVFFLRRPYDRGSVPRDVVASKGKTHSGGPGLLVWPSRVYRETLVDQADDASHDAVAVSDDAEDVDDHEFEESSERRAELVERLRRDSGE